MEFLFQNKRKALSTVGLGSVLVFLVLSLLLNSTGIATENSQLNPEFLQRLWHAEDGLPNPVVRKILQTKDGYLWLGTDECLARFDGMSFTELDRKDFRLRNDRWLVGLAEEADGTLWASASNGGILRFQDGQFTQFTTNNGLLDNYVLSAHVDKKGTVWIGGRAGLTKFENGKFTILTNEPGLITEAIRTIVEDTDGTLWIGTASGLSTYKNGAFDSSINDTLPERSIMAVCFARDGAVWIGTPNGLTHLSNGKIKHYTSDHGLAHNTVRSILEDSSGNVWVGTHGGLQRINQGEFFSVRFRDSSSLETGDSISDMVYDIIEDREGNVWVGTNVGLKRFRPKKFTVYSREEGLLHDQVTCVYEDSAGVIWFGTFGGGLSRLENGEITTFDTETGLPSNHILSVFEDDEGTLWIGTDLSGLVRYRHGTFKTYRGRNAQANVVRAIHQDREGTLWILNNSGVEKFKNEKFEIIEDLRILSPRAMLEDSKGYLWVANKAGLTRWKAGEPTTKYRESDGLSSEWVNAIYEDAKGSIWIGTELGGLNRYKDGVFTNYGAQQGFRERILHILEDKSDRFWLGTKNGIFSIGKTELDNYLDGKAATANLVSYGRVDGMRRRQCNGIGQPAGLASKEGRLWFPTLLGAVSFDPAGITSSSFVPNVLLEKVMARGEPLDPNLHAELPAGKGDIEFYYTGLSFSVPERVQFQYKMEGVDTIWQDAGTRRVAHYTILRPGNYRFRVKARNNDGPWSEADDSFSFSISPHFYQTYSFYLISGFIIAGSGLGFYRLRLRRLKRREQELMTMVNSRTKELRQEIIERKQAERHSNVFSRLGQRLSLAKSAEEAAKVIVEAADELLGWDACILFSYDEQDDKGRALVFYDVIEGKRTDITLPNREIGLSPVGRRTIKHGGQLILRKEPIKSGPEYSLFGDKSRPSASLLYVPIYKAEKVVGVLTIQSYRINAYTPADLETLQALADYCGSTFEQIRAETALRESQQMVLRQERLAAVGQLSAGVAHEFNNILTVIRGHASLLLENKEIEGEATESLEQISNSAERAANLTRQMLAFSRKQLLQPKTVDLNAISSQITKMLERLIGENISITCDLQRDLPPICADPGMIEQVIINLTLNARDAMPKGGQLKVCTSLANVTDTPSRRRSESYIGSFVCLTISDTGCGMSEETQQKIFEPFFTTKDVGQGTGLGLATVYGIVKQHQGWIEVSSKVGEGTAFTIFLPADTKAQLNDTGKIPKPAVKGGRETILFVEDEPDIRQLARQVLEQFGYAVIEAGSGVEALNIWKERKDEIHLLLTDMMMPEGVSGGDLARKLRVEKPDLKVIYMSGYSLEILEKDLSDQKDFRFLEKPYRPQTLVEMVRECLDENKNVPAA